MAGGGISLDRGDWLRIALAWLAVGLFSASISSTFHDADDLLRLLQVRAWLDGQSWYDLTQYRIDAPKGVAMHWSRWVDLPLAGAILAARFVTGAAVAEAFALMAVPLLTLGCAVALVYRAARILFDVLTATIAALLTMACPAILLQIHPSRIDHHGWQIVLALAALNALLGDRAKGAAWLLGGALALWLAISLEGLPMTVGILGVLALRWLRDPAERGWLVQASGALAVCSAVLWLATHRMSPAALMPWCDVVTPIHLAIFVGAAAGIALLARYNPVSWFGVTAGLGVIAAGAVLIQALAAPACLGGAITNLDPLVADKWLGRVGEAAPLWEQPLTTALMLLGPALVGLASLGVIAARQSAPNQLASIAYALVLLGAVILALVLTRATAVACALALPALAAQLRRWLSQAAEARPARKLALVATIMIAIMPWLPVAILNRSAQAEPVEPAPGTCDPEAAKAQLAALPKSKILAPIDLGPQLLLASHHTIVASAHHRGARGMDTTIRAFLGSPSDARRRLTDERIGFVAVCPSQVELEYYAKEAPHSFAATLSRNSGVPAWLRPVPMPGASGLRLWRVVP